MQQSPQKKRLANLGRLLPYVTILGAAAALVVSSFGLITLSIAESIIIALLGLLAIDSIVERLSILERLNNRLFLLDKIDNDLSAVARGPLLKTRKEIITPAEHAQHASEVCILAVHGTAAILFNRGFFEEKIKHGCSFRVILVDPQSPALVTFGKMVDENKTPHEIEVTLEVLEKMAEKAGASGSCEVRFLPVFLPFSMFAVDLSKRTGSMIVEYHPYRLAGDQRPHLHLKTIENPHWFEYYRQQFEKAWNDGETWKTSVGVVQNAD